jgi:hypothetical protein
MELYRTVSWETEGPQCWLTSWIDCCKMLPGSTLVAAIKCLSAGMQVQLMVWVLGKMGDMRSMWWGEREEGQLGEQMEDLLCPHECQAARSSSILHISVAAAMPKSILEKPLSRCNSKSQWSSSMLSKSCDNLCAYEYLCDTTVDSSVEVTAILRSISEVIAQDCKCRHRLHSSYARSRSGNWKEWRRACRKNNLQMQFLYDHTYRSMHIACDDALYCFCWSTGSSAHLELSCCLQLLHLTLQP